MNVLSFIHTDVTHTLLHAPPFLPLLPLLYTLTYIHTSAFEGPVLISQGANDPLNDSAKRAKLFQDIRENIKVVLIPLYIHTYCMHTFIYSHMLSHVNILIHKYKYIHIYIGGFVSVRALPV